MHYVFMIMAIISFGEGAYLIQDSLVVSAPDPDADFQLDIYYMEFLAGVFVVLMGILAMYLFYN